MNLDFYVPLTRRLKRSLCAKDVMLIQSYCVEVKPEKLKILLFEFSAEMVVDCQRCATLCVDVPELLKITGFEWFFHILLTSVRTPSFVLFRFSQFILQRWFSSLKQIVIEFFVLHNQSRYFFFLAWYSVKCVKQILLGFVVRFPKRRRICEGYSWRPWQFFVS